jgi:hypothetical protein
MQSVETEEHLLQLLCNGHNLSVAAISRNNSGAHLRCCCSIHLCTAQ